MTYERENRRDQILRATSALLARGADPTLDAVARAAGVSKGGLLYHFPSKDALLGALVEHMTTTFDVALAQALADAPAEPGRWLRAYVAATCGESAETLAATVGLVAVFASNPVLLDPLRAAFARWRSSADNDGIDPARAQAVRLAADGLWLADVLGLAPVVGEERDRLRARLIAMTYETDGDTA